MDLLLALCRQLSDSTPHHTWVTSNNVCFRQIFAGCIGLASAFKLDEDLPNLELRRFFRDGKLALAGVLVQSPDGNEKTS